MQQAIILRNPDPFAEMPPGIGISERLFVDRCNWHRVSFPGLPMGEAIARLKHAGFEVWAIEVKSISWVSIRVKLAITEMPKDGSVTHKQQQCDR